jgi:predicted AlkP superfamily phosphohydrolase/phosphomutase
MRQANPRLMMLGLDAVSLPFVLENRSKLPNLSSLLNGGTLRKLRSSASYLSASVWPTFSTGTQPGEHGQYFPFQWSPEHRHYLRVADPSWSDGFDCPPFWHRVAQAGLPTIAFDIAHALHDERAPCLQITNWSYQSSGAAKASHPEVLRDIRRRFGRRPIGPEVPVPKSARQCEAIRDQLIRAVRAKADATLHLMSRPWNLFVTGWYEIHRAGHNLWPVDGDFASDASPDAMLAVYAETDRQLGRVMAALEQEGTDSSLLLFALHGMEPNRAQDHFLPEILSRLNRLYLGEPLNGSSKPGSLNPVAFLRRALPPTLQYRAASLLGERIQDWVVDRALVAGRDWCATPSFPLLSGGEGLIRLNVKGRESPGYFEPGSAELAGYAGWLGERLSAIKVAATGEPLIRKIVLVDQELPGSRRDFLPDLILDWAPDAPVRRICSPDIGDVEVSLATGRGGNHNDSAFVIASGEDELLRAVDPIRDIARLGDVAQGFLLDGKDSLTVAKTGTPAAPID